MKNLIKNISNATCTGCGACVSACPKKCIELQYDKEGFSIAHINQEECIDCGRCTKVCHVQNKPIPKKYESRSYAAVNSTREVALESSSGGIFWLLVKYIIEEKNGVVYGAVCDSDLKVRHTRATSLEECVAFRRSKYLQSDTQGIFQCVKEDLQNHQVVLFSGTPCQVAALYTFLEKEYDNLYTCDVVCHGTPSQGVFEDYKKWLEKQHHSSITNIEWRDKRNGWKPNYVSYQFENGDEIYEASTVNIYQAGFLKNIYLRNHCYQCAYASLPRTGDISLADYWKYSGELVKEEYFGISIVLVSSRKGEELFDGIKSECKYHEVPIEDVKAISRHVALPPEWNFKRKLFFKDYLKGVSFDKLDKKYIHQNIWTKGLVKIQALLQRN